MDVNSSLRRPQASVALRSHRGQGEASKRKRDNQAKRKPKTIQEHIARLQSAAAMFRQQEEDRRAAAAERRRDEERWRNRRSW